MRILENFRNCGKGDISANPLHWLRIASAISPQIQFGLGFRRSGWLEAFAMWGFLTRKISRRDGVEIAWEANFLRLDKINRRSWLDLEHERTIESKSG